MVLGALKELLLCKPQPHGDVYVGDLITVKCVHVPGQEIQPQNENRIVKGSTFVDICSCISHEWAVISEV